MKRILFLLCLSIQIQLYAQPTDNPYRSYYGISSNYDHWTDSIRWKNVENISDPKYNAYSSWDLKYYAAAKILQQKGGGVVYFPPLPLSQQTGLDSTYYFPTHLFLQTNALIRGARSLVPNATDSAFAPQTLFEFPKYLFNGITNVPNSTAFKFIVLQNPDSAFNTGIVDVDINRATIHLSQTFQDTVFTSAGVTIWPTKNLTGNIMILSVRQNNAAIPDPSIPSTVAPQQQSWQRWSYRLGFNMNINANKNIVVCNNRINDFVHNTTRPISSDNFQQPGYIVSGSYSGLAGSQSVFDYAAHYGLLVNRLKQDSINLSISQLGSYKSYLAGPSTAAEEPNLYATGIEIKNNWIYKTQRISIQASGNGLVISNNVLRDNPNKQLFTNGIGLLTTTTNLENAGIDYTGWNVFLGCNDIEVERTLIGAQKIPSSDGNGFYSQPSSSATVVNHIVRNNTVRIANPGIYGTCVTGKCANGYTLWDTDINNVLMEGNNSGSLGLIVDAENIASTPPIPRDLLNNVIVRNNTNIYEMVIRGEKGGSLSYAYYNVGYSANPKIVSTNILTRSCNVSLSSDTSSNYNNATSNPNFTVFTTQTCCQGSGTGINPSPNCIPVVKWQTPLNDTTIYRFSSDSLVTFKAAVTYCSPDSVVFYLDNERIGRANYSNGIATLNYLLKKSDRNAHLLVAYAYKYEIIDCSGLYLPPDTNHTITYSSAALIGLNFNPAPLTAPCNAAQVVTHLNLSPFLQQNLEVYPNPFDESFFIKAPNSTTNWQAQVFDVTGKKIYGGPLTITASSPGIIEAGNWPKGIYYLVLNSGNQTFTKKLLKW